MEPERPNKVKAVFQGTTYSYSVTFKQFGSCLCGTMTDAYYPTTGPIHGTVRGNYVTFTFANRRVHPGNEDFTGTSTRSGTASGTEGHRWNRWVFRYGIRVRHVVGDRYRER